MSQTFAENVIQNQAPHSLSFSITNASLFAHPVSSSKTTNVQNVTKTVWSALVKQKSAQNVTTQSSCLETRASKFAPTLTTVMKFSANVSLANHHARLAVEAWKPARAVIKHCPSIWYLKTNATRSALRRYQCSVKANACIALIIAKLARTRLTLAPRAMAKIFWTILIKDA